MRKPNLILFGTEKGAVPFIWFLLVSSPGSLVLYSQIFTLTNPNKVRSLIGRFCAGNIAHFHHSDGSGYAFLAFNFRGYRFSEGKISISNQVSDAVEIAKFVRKMAEHNLFDLNDINLLAHDFGAYIGLILCSKIDIINKLILISPILDLKKHVYNDEFIKTLNYINRFLPGNVQGIEKVDDFIKMTKVELSQKQFQIREFIKKLKNNRLKIITGDEDKITPSHDVNKILQNSNITPEITLIECMDHECSEEEDIERISNEIRNFLKC